MQTLAKSDWREAFGKLAKISWVLNGSCHVLSGARSLEVEYTVVSGTGGGGGCVQEFTESTEDQSGG